MKVILTGELKGHGGEGDVIEVTRGFANNYLLPQHRAIPATPGNLKQLEARKHHIEKREAQRLAEAGDYSKLLDGKAVIITVKVGDAGRLFGSVTAAIIADAIKDEYGIEVDRHKIETHGTIKTIGEHAAEIAVYREIKAHLTIKVIGEGTEEEHAEKEASVKPEAAEADAPTEEAPASNPDDAPEDAPEDTPEAAPEDAPAEPEPEPEAAQD